LRSIHPDPWKYHTCPLISRGSKDRIEEAMLTPLPTLLLQSWRPSRKGPPDRLEKQELVEVANALVKLSGGLNRRDLSGQRYLNQSVLLGAYLLYYFPVSYAQAKYVLSQTTAPKDGLALELGCGPGPASKALIEAGFTVEGYEQSEAALKLAEKLLGARFHGHRWTDLKIPSKTCELIWMGHFLNELFEREPDRVERRARLVLNAWELLKQDGTLILVEPASHVINQDFLRLRDRLISAGLPLQAPCFYQKACPSLAMGAACHSALRWRAPVLVEQLAKAARIDKTELAFGYLVFKKGEHKAGYRVISEKLTNKAGRERVVVCGEQGRQTLSVDPKKPASGWEDTWKGIGRGDALWIEGAEARPENGLGLGVQSRLSRLLPGDTKER
jgi:SAM-dependent methyltransferase